MKPAARLSPRPLFRGHWKSLTNVATNRQAADWVTRLALLGAVALAPLGWLLGWSLRAPTPILSGVALLGGALVGSFGQVNTLRLKVTDRLGDDDPTTKIDRDALDESAAHVLTAAYLCGLTAALLVLGINLSPDKSSNPAVVGFWGPAAMSTGAYALITFFIAVPRLYSAYVQVNNVSPAVSGYTVTRWGKRGEPRTGLEAPEED